MWQYNGAVKSRWFSIPEVGDNYLDWLTGTDAESRASVGRIDVSTVKETVGIEFQEAAEAWQMLDVPSNQPDFGSANAPTMVTDMLTDTPSRYSRVHIFAQ